MSGYGRALDASARLARIFLAVVLVVGFLPARAFAQDTANEADASQAVLDAVDGIDLADVSQWSHMNSYSLAPGGYYYLSDDVTVTDTGGILFFAAGHATLDLRGHTLSFGEETSSSGIYTTGLKIGGESGSAVQLDIVSTTGGTGSICFYNTESALTLYETAQVSIDNVNVEKKMNVNPGTKGYIVGSGTAAVSIINKSNGTSSLTLQSFRASNCSITTDLSEFTRQPYSDVACAIYVSSHALSAVELDHVAVGCVAPESVTTTSGDYVNAYGIYCENADRLGESPDFTIEDSTISATSLKAGAFGICDAAGKLSARHYGAIYTLQGESNSIELSESSSASGWALGSLRDEKDVIKLDSAIEVSAFNASTHASIQPTCDIRIGGELGLTLLEGFSSSRQLGIYAGSDSFDSNYDEMAFASNETGRSDASVADCFFNALYAANMNTCKVSAYSGELVFATDESAPIVEVDDADGTVNKYGSFIAGLKHMASSATLKLLTDMPEIDVVVGESVSATIDLNGHSLGSLVSTSDGDIVVTSSAEGAELQHEITLAKGYVGVLANNGAGALEVENVSIASTSRSSSVRTCAVYVGGSGGVVLENCNVVADGHSWTAGIVSVAYAPILLRNTVVSASSETSNSMGLFSSTSAMVQVDECSFSATSSGTDGKSDAIRLGGTGKIGSHTARITSSSLEATSEGSWSYGLYVSGSGWSVDLSADELSAINSGDVSTSVCAALFCSSESSTCDIKDCSLSSGVASAKASASQSYWSMIVGGSETQVSVAGNLSLKSSEGQHIKYGCPITVSDTATITTDADDDSIATSATVRTSGDAIFACSEEMAAVLKPRIDEQSGSVYENITQSESGWQLSYDVDAKALVWSAEPVATVSGKGYPTLQDAIAAANEGDTIQIISDISSSRVVTVPKGLTIDLCGHEVTLRSYSLTGALLVTAAAGSVVKITDSQSDAADTGRLTLLVGKELEQEDLIDGRSSNAGNLYTGIYLKGAAGFTLNDCEISVVYAGDANECAVGVQGIYQGQSAGTVNFVNARLDVQATDEDGSALSASISDTVSDGNAADVGAVRAYGIYSDATSANLAIDASSEVVVANANSPLLRGVDVNRLLSGDTDTSYSAALVSDGTVKEVSLDSSDTLYQETCELFLYEAKYDSNASVYYACPLELSDGTLVWAISDVVPASEVGSKSAIVPTHFYMQSSYLISPDAKGIVLGGFSGEVSLAGSVSARSSLGDATAIDASQAKNQLVCKVNGATLLASSSANREINVCTGEEPDAGVELGLDSSWWKNSKASVHEIVQRMPMACLFVGNDGAQQQLVLSGSTKLKVSGENAVAFVVNENSVQISKDWKAASDGDARLGVGCTWRDNVPGAVFATGAVSEEMTDLFYDAAGDLLLVYDNGTLRWDGVCTVEFVDAVGTVLQSTSGVTQGQTVAVPDSSLVEKASNASFTYEFLGWVVDAAATEPDILSGQTAFAFEPVAGQSTVTYRPLYRTSPVRVEVSFTGMHDRSDVSYVADAGAELQKSISSQDMTAAIPTLASYEQGDVTYVPIGWKVRCGDDDFVLTANATAEYKPYDNVSCKAVYVAVGSNQSLAEFVVDGEVYATVVNVGSSPRWVDASGESSPPSRTSYGMTCSFAGWQGVLDTYGFTDALPVVQQAGTCVTYTATFNETPALYDVDFVGVYFKNERGRYVCSTSETKVYCPYGSNPVDSLMNGNGTQPSFVQDGYVYTLSGWSTRQGDAEPIYQSDELPAVTPDKRGSLGLVYYAYYDVAPATTSVVFYVGDSMYAIATDINTSSTIAEAFAETHFSEPQVQGREFVGWAAASDATSAPSSITSIENYIDADTNRVTLWAVFKSSDSDADSRSDSDTPSGGESDGDGQQSSSGSVSPSTHNTITPSVSTATGSTRLSTSASSSAAEDSDVAGSADSVIGSDLSSAASGASGNSNSAESGSSQVDSTAGQGNVLATLFAIIVVLLVALFIWWRMRRKNSMFEDAALEVEDESDDEWDQITFDEEDFD